MKSPPSPPKRRPLGDLPYIILSQFSAFVNTFTEKFSFFRRRSPFFCKKSPFFGKGQVVFPLFLRLRAPPRKVDERGQKAARLRLSHRDKKGDFFRIITRKKGAGLRRDKKMRFRDGGTSAPFGGVRYLRRPLGRGEGAGRERDRTRSARRRSAAREYGKLRAGGGAPLRQRQ